MRWAMDGHALGEGCEDRGGAADGVGLERFAAGEHEDDECAGQVFAEQDRGDDRNAGEQVGAELAIGELDEEFPDQRDAAESEREPEGRVLNGLGAMQAEAEDEVRGNGGDRKQGDGKLLPVERRRLGHDGVRGCVLQSDAVAGDGVNQGPRGTSEREGRCFDRG